MQSAAMAANKHLHTAMRLLTAKRTYCLVGFPGNCPLAQLFPSGHSMSALPRNSIDSGGQPGTKGPRVKKPGAGFGASLYWNLVLACANWCDVEINLTIGILGTYSAIYRKCRMVLRA